MTDMTNGPRVTRALLACGAIGASLFLLLFHVDAAVRPGYEFLRHGPSLLMTGDLGWIEITNFVATGVLMGAYGLGMISTGVFVTDPQLGFPPGTPAGPAPRHQRRGELARSLSWPSSAPRACRATDASIHPRVRSGAFACW